MHRCNGQFRQIFVKHAISEIGIFGLFLLIDDILVINKYLTNARVVGIWFQI